jgi:sortase A
MAAERSGAMKRRRRRGTLIVVIATAGLGAACLFAAAKHYGRVRTTQLLLHAAWTTAERLGGEPTAVDLWGVRARPYGRLEIPSVGLDLIVLEGCDEKTLRWAPGAVGSAAAAGPASRTAGSALPAESVVVAGHRDGAFAALEGVAEGDSVRLARHGEERTLYRIVAIRVVDPEEAAAIPARDRGRLHLVTCHPFRFVGPAPMRWVATAVAI